MRRNLTGVSSSAIVCFFLPYKKKTFDLLKATRYNRRYPSISRWLNAPFRNDRFLRLFRGFSNRAGKNGQRWWIVADHKSSTAFTQSLEAVTLALWISFPYVLAIDIYTHSRQRHRWWMFCTAHPRWEKPRNWPGVFFPRQLKWRYKKWWLLPFSSTYDTFFSR